MDGKLSAKDGSTARLVCAGGVCASHAPVQIHFMMKSCARQARFTRT